jgi:hypothetical protein
MSSILVELDTRSMATRESREIVHIGCKADEFPDVTHTPLPILQYPDWRFNYNRTTFYSKQIRSK